MYMYMFTFSVCCDIFWALRRAFVEILNPQGQKITFCAGLDSQVLSVVCKMLVSYVQRFLDLPKQVLLTHYDARMCNRL